MRHVLSKNVYARRRRAVISGMKRQAGTGSDVSNGALVVGCRRGHEVTVKGPEEKPQVPEHVRAQPDKFFPRQAADAVSSLFLRINAQRPTHGEAGASLEEDARQPHNASPCC